ncbi:MAG: hypothetical protein JRH15_15505, partial [Deltaproteobacteria bacterium]|nr:hypothetical protein [Deltaproteobacteria bacterium]
LVVTAHAYVLQGPHLLMLMSENLGKAATLVVEQKLRIHPAADPGLAVEIPETLTYRFPHSFRSESVSAQTHRIHVDTLNDRITLYDARISADDNGRFDRYKDLLLLRSRLDLSDRLSKAGVDVSVSSLGRLDGEPIYVIGAQYPDHSRSQVWFHKDTFQPLKWLLVEDNADTGLSVLEFRYLQWRKTKRIWYPERIACYENEKLVREMIVDQLTIDAPIPAGSFDIDRLRSAYEPLEVEETRPSGDDTPSDINQVIEDFKKRYE